MTIYVILGLVIRVKWHGHWILKKTIFIKTYLVFY